MVFDNWDTGSYIYCVYFDKNDVFQPIKINPISLVKVTNHYQEDDL